MVGIFQDRRIFSTYNYVAYSRHIYIQPLLILTLEYLRSWWTVLLGYINHLQCRNYKKYQASVSSFNLLIQANLLIWKIKVHRGLDNQGFNAYLSCLFALILHISWVLTRTSVYPEFFAVYNFHGSSISWENL